MQDQQFIADDGEVWWIATRERCVNCGVMSSYASWKVGARADLEPGDILVTARGACLAAPS